MFPNDNDFESQFTFENAATPIPEEPPFHILLLGDWSGNLTNNGLEDRRPVVIDRDNFDEVIEKLNVGLELDLEGEVLSFQFSELDDFHPDNLYRNISVFADLRDIRRRLSDPDTFNSAASEVRSWFETAENTGSDSQIRNEINDTPPIESNDLLDMILTQPSESATPKRRQNVDKSELGRFVSKIVSPYLIKIDENEQAKLIAAVDETISGLMRKVLHHPKYQALESAWRGLYFLVRRLETDAQLKIFILDVSKDEFVSNLKAVNNLTDSFLYRLLLNESSESTGIESLAVVAGNYSFNLDVDDVASLMRFGKISGAADTPFVTHISPKNFGVEGFSENFEASQFKVLEDSNEGKLWAVLRSSAEANFIGLSPMKILARMPYGLLGDSTENFAFEEIEGKSEHDNYLWMNPCFGLALLLGQSFRLSGWQFERNLQIDIENLPLVFIEEDGEKKTIPAAEIVLTEKLLESIIEQGLIPLVSFRNGNKIRVGRFQSISLSKPELKGKWSL